MSDADGHEQRQRARASGLLTTLLLSREAGTSASSASSADSAKDERKPRVTTLSSV